MARNIEFERGQVLEKAMQAFWAGGYNATSMANLVEVTELGPGSIYAAFDSKQGLFLATLDHYGAHRAAKIEQTLAQSTTPLEGIRKLFRQLATDSAGENAKLSCLLVNTVLELARQNETVQKRVNHHLNTIEALFRQSLEAAQASGELSAEKNPGALAACLMTNIWGLRVLGATGPTAERTQAIVDQILSLLT